MLKYINTDKKFARIEDGVVTDVIEIECEGCCDSDGNHLESIGVSQCQMKKSGTWLESKTDNSSFRGNEAFVGFTYHTEVATLGVGSTDVFMSSRPYPSWVGIHTERAEWIAPIQRPVETDEQIQNHQYYNWDEDLYQSDNTQGWILTQG
jgi:hypothetical protein